jgi:2-hydroxy-3-keto-5-methylthiopentenyl-1-phosphate phosphatase
MLKPVIKVAEPVTKFPKSEETDPLTVIELIETMIREHYALKKLKETEKTKRIKIEKTTEVILRKLDTLEKLGLKAIEKDFRLREAIIKLVGKKLEESDNPQVVASCLNILIETLRNSSCKEEIEAVARLIHSNKETEI